MTNYIKKYKLKGTPKIKQFINAKGNAQANHFSIEFDNAEVFQSYDSIIAIRLYSQPYNILGAHHNYSVTTGKHLTHWLGRDSKERKEQIKQGKLIVDDKLV